MGIRERKEREKGARREEIINAAETIFFDKGFAVATMDEIADRAELSKGTLYLYYRSKEDLYIATALRGWEILRRMFAEAASTGEHPLKLLSNIGNAYFTYFKQHRNYYRMSYYLGNANIHSQVSEEMMGECMESDKKIWDIVSSAVQQAIDEGMMREGIVALEAGVMLWANSDSLMRLMDHDEKGWLELMGLDLENLLRKSNRLLIEGMLTDKGKRKLAQLFEDVNDFFPRRQSGNNEKKRKL
ncbi:MAG: TetR/AcrR family transcriptional regulator [Bacteroidota bacterium]